MVVHEWGTFTSVAGADGSAAQWQPLNGRSDLPCFVRTLPDSPKTIDPESYAYGLPTLMATVRMETPVLYFYAPQEERVDVAVEFRRGLVTEWFPAASSTQPSFAPLNLTNTNSTIRWNGVRVMPGTTANYLQESTPSHYYAARETDAAPVQVGGQTEKFLFYRGLGTFAVPVSATVSDRGKIAIDNTGSHDISHVVLFENRAGRIGYRMAAAPRGRIVLDSPVLSGDVTSLRADLKAMLIEQGLFEREAAAMVETWRDSWFEQGSRVFYILPQPSVDAILPLTISPAPERVVRAFVGRLEVITPAILDDVASAFAMNDVAALDKHGRFLDSIAARLMEKRSPGLEPFRVRATLQRIAASHLPATTCK
jgi:hypothetical protein